MRLFKKSYSEGQSFRNIILVLVTICIVVGIVCIRFYDQVQQTIQNESEHYLREISNRISTNIERTIDDNFAILDTMSSVLEGENILPDGKLGVFLREQEEYWGFHTVMLISESGVTYDFNGNEVVITGDSFLRYLSSDENIIAPSQIINNEEMLIFATPINVKFNGVTITALATCYGPEEFHNLLSMTSFDEKAYSYIVDKKGKAITRSKSTDNDKFGYNIINTIAGNGSNSLESITKLKSDMKNQIANQYKFNINGNNEYLIYTPIDLDGWELFTFVPESTVNEKSTILLRSTLFIIGLIFMVFLFFLLVIYTSISRNKKRLERLVYVDELTKGDSSLRFRENVKRELSESSIDNHALIFINIQRFKVLNDQYGRDMCNLLLQNIHDGIKKNLQSDEYIAHRTADNYSVLIRYEQLSVLQDRFEMWHKAIDELVQAKMINIPQYTMEYGVYVIDDLSIPFDDMIDCTKLALRSKVFIHAKNDHIHYAFYDEATRLQLLREKHLEDRMELALSTNEFRMYLQPKYLTSSVKIGGAEALVRWDSKEDGMLCPNDFIPIFEKNGFIIKLDLWMFEQVCQLLQKWQDTGIDLIKISVNCSRAHLNNIDFLDTYKAIFTKYSFPSHYLELEFTENMVFDETQRLIKIIDQIHEIGFSCSMDDFGSGYSSLNLLQEIHVDTLKLDRIFFKKTFTSDLRAQAIVSSVLDLAQSLNMTTVAEGVEEHDQVAYLNKMGCDLIQGYVYAKPMTVNQFEEILFQEVKGEKS